MRFSLQTCILCVGLLMACSTAPTLADPNTVSLAWNSLLSDLMCKKGVIFHSAAFYESMLNLAQWHSLLALRTAGSTITSQTAVVAYASHYVVANYFRYEADFLLDPTLKAQLDALHLTPAKKNLARILAHSVAGPLINSQLGQGTQYNYDFYKYPSVKDAMLGEFSWIQPPEDYFMQLPEPLLGQLNSARPYTLPSAEVFRQAYLLDVKPPTVPSAEFDALYDISFEFGQRNSTKRTPDQTASAYFWHGSAKGGACNQVTPWIKAAITAMPPGLPLYDTVVLMAKLSVAQYDASLLFVNIQQSFRFWRPAQGIRRGDPHHAPVPDWTPLVPNTNAHPEYPSGICTIAGASKCILEAFIKNPSTVVVGGGNPDGIVQGSSRTFKTWGDAAQDTANGRVFAGVHWRKSAQDGLLMGCRVAEYVMKHWAEPAPSGVLPGPSSLVFFGGRPSAQGVPNPPGWQLPTSAADFDAPIPAHL